MSARDHEIVQNASTTEDTEGLSIDKNTIGTDWNYKHTYNWYMVLSLTILHICSFFSFQRLFMLKYKFLTFVWTFFLINIIYQSVCIGAHRYYTHKSFKARLPLRIYFIIGHTLAGQNALRTWVRDHRLHHRCSDTDADPHNSERGFFFSHVGWLMMKKHPLVRQYGKTTDISDLLADPLVNFQYKYFLYLHFLIAFLIPVAVPVYMWGETWSNAILGCYFGKYVYTLHCTWLVNSWAHLYGTKPYDKGLKPGESWFVSFMTLGEGWHNFHHIFPWDYRGSGSDLDLNVSASIIRFLERIGLVNDLKTAPKELIEKKILQNGDGSHHTLVTKSTE